MSQPIRRRCFLREAAAGGTLLGLGGLEFLSGLPPISAAEAKPAPGAVRLQPDIEPLVRLLEETPRERLLEVVGARVRQGLSYHQLLAALLLAGVRNVQPRPSVGFKFHAVLAVNSVYEASLAAADADRWLALFWALDYFKESQARNVREGGWRMQPVDETRLPEVAKTEQAFRRAMDDWDESAADAAAARLARTAGAGQVFELLYRYGARDFRDIGHKAIFVANTQRVLSQVGWRHAEPVLRSLAYALLAHEGENPARRDAAADHPWRRNQELAAKIPADWLSGKPSREATVELLAALRQEKPDAVCDAAVQLLRRGTAPQSLWDALFCGAAELLLRQPGIVALHAVTTTNALHYAYLASGDDQTRRLVLLQNAAFLPMFRQAMQGRGRLRETAIDRLQPIALTGSSAAGSSAAGGSAAGGSAAVEEVFAEMGRDRQVAVGKTLAHLTAKGSAEDFMATARRLILLKGSDPHDFKFSVAALEDYYHLSPDWRDRYLAAGVLQLRGSGGKDNALVHRIRAAVQ
jgi:hypothetical protein